jgi:pimeloyl-ACP methyl ester carboxylesterase
MILLTSVLLTVFLLALLGMSYWISELLLYAWRQPVTCTPADYGLMYEDVTFLSQDGLTLKGGWISAEARAKEYGPVVIICHPMFGNRHGLCVQRQAWPRLFWTDVDLLQTAQAFHQAGYAVLMFDFRSHGESQRGLCAGGLTEDQDVMGAVDYVFSRIATETAAPPSVGVVGFGLGAAAALAAVGWEKGGAEVIRVFSGDSEGGSGFIEIQPANVKRLRFLVAVQPASLGVLLRGYLHQMAGPSGWVLVPLVDRICQWRGGYPLAVTSLLKRVSGVHIPVLYIQSHSDPWGKCGEVQSLYNATPGLKQICWIEEPFGRLETYVHVGEHLETVLAFAAQYTSKG